MILISLVDAAFQPACTPQRTKAKKTTGAIAVTCIARKLAVMLFAAYHKRREQRQSCIGIPMQATKLLFYAIPARPSAIRAASVAAAK